MINIDYSWKSYVKQTGSKNEIIQIYVKHDSVIYLKSNYAINNLNAHMFQDFDWFYASEFDIESSCRKGITRDCSIQTLWAYDEEYLNHPIW